MTNKKKNIDNISYNLIEFAQFSLRSATHLIFSQQIIGN